MKKLLFSLILLSLASISRSQTPTWSQDVASIVYNRCAGCHHSGGIAPFSLMSYADVVNNTSAIKAAVLAGNMPPWPPDQNVRHFAYERVLAPKEKTDLLNWLDNGRPAGDLSKAPAAPVFNGSGDLQGVPDLTLKIPLYTSAAVSGDVYRCFVLPTGLTANKFINALEAIPGNRSIVHHVLIYADTTGTSTILDAADPGPGYTSFGGIGTSKAILIGGWVPGTKPMQYPAGFGTLLHSNAKVVVQIHYPLGSAGLKDSTELHFFFAPPGPTRNLYIQAALNHNDNINAPLSIPPNTIKSFYERLTVPNDATLFGVAPHMHLIGKNIESFGINPGGDTTHYISIPNWDFHWQGFYMFRKAEKVAMNTIVVANATYDNTSSNPNNPNTPPKQVNLGEATTDEMMLVFFVFTEYQPGDENIVMDNTAPAAVQNVVPDILKIQTYPNPAQGQLYARIQLNRAVIADLTLTDIQGRLVRQLELNKKIPAGQSEFSFDISSLTNGTYFLQIRTESAVKTQTVHVLH